MITLYEPNETDFTHNGLGVLDANIYNAVVEEILNGLFIFSFEYPLFAPHGLEIDGQCIIKVPTPDGEQLFRVVRPQPDMGKLKVNCYHIFYDLKDNFIEDTFIVEKSGAGALEQISSNCQYKHPFQFFSDITKVANSRLVRKNPVEAILDTGQDNCFLNRWGGELKRDNFKVSMLQQRGKNRGVVIQHRKDLLGYEGDVDWDSPITRIMPIGFNGLLLPEKYVDSPNINKYTHPKIKLIEFGHIKAAIGENENDDDAVPLEEAYKLLREAAKDMYEVQKVDLPKATYNVKFQELSQTEEYKDYAVLQRVYMGDTVTVQHKEDNLDIQAKVISYKYDPLKEEYMDLIIGDYKDAFANLDGKVDQIQDNMSGMETSFLDKAKEHATNLINSGFGGHVRVYPERILIMDTDNEMTAEKVWQWNINGLGYSSTGINGPYGLAMTIDGQIVADFITTGILSAALLKTGVIKGQKGNMMIDLDNDKLRIEGGAIAVVRPDGYEWIQNGIPTLAMAVTEHVPPFKAQDVEQFGVWFRGKYTYYVDAGCLFGLKHEGRYLNLRIFIGAEDGGGGDLRVMNKETGEAVAHVPIYNGVGSGDENIGYGELRILKIDMGIPTGELRQYNVEFRSNNAKKWVYFRKEMIWIDG